MSPYRPLGITIVTPSLYHPEQCSLFCSDWNQTRHCQQLQAVSGREGAGRSQQAALDLVGLGEAGSEAAERGRNRGSPALVERLSPVTVVVELVGRKPW